MQTAIRIRTDWVALLFGLAVAAALVATWRIDNGGIPAPARVEIVTAPSQEIAVSPDGVTAEAQKLVASLPEDGLRRQLHLRNATDVSLETRVKALVDSPALGQEVELDVRAGSLQVYGGPLAGLTSGSQPFTLDPGQSLDLAVQAWIPDGASPIEWSGRNVSIQLELVSEGA
jgi:hypothetical protein